MALDVYAGSLTRYYAGAWENPVERGLRGQDAAQHLQSITPADATRSQDRIRPRVIAWRAALARALGDRLAGPVEWDESEVAPWYTRRLGWDGFGSLVLWATRLRRVNGPNFTWPLVEFSKTVPEKWLHASGKLYEGKPLPRVSRDELLETVRPDWREKIRYAQEPRLVSAAGD